MVNCNECDNFQDEYPIKIIDRVPSSPFENEIYHFEDGYKCTWNGNEGLTIKELQKGNCRCRG